MIKSVADTNTAVKFYHDVLSLQLKFESPGWSEFVTGENHLTLHPFPTRTQREKSSWVSLSPMSRLTGI